MFHSRYEIGIGLVENKRSWTTAEHELAVEAGAAASVAGSTSLLDPDPDRVLIAIDPHLDHALDLAGAFALSP